MPSLTTAIKYHSGSATDDGVTNGMYFPDTNSEKVVIAEEPFYYGYGYPIKSR